jgi:hypothetical protein
MPAVLTHKTIMLLARERLAEVRDILTRKIATAGATVSDLEHRILYLATKAYDLMSDHEVGTPDIEYPTVQRTIAPNFVQFTGLGNGVSRFAVMGSMGPDITGFSALLSPGNSWVFDTVHKGNPDQNREPVMARTTDFALDFGRQVSTAIDSRASAAAADKQKAQAQMRAYVMGHLCHIVGDVLSHPFINDIEWHLGVGSHNKFSHSGGEGSIDAKVARQLLQRPSTREGQAWAVWWPVTDSVPAEFFTAYDAALEQIYTARTKRPTGFGGFEAEFAKLSPPGLNSGFVRDGYSVYRNGILPIGYGWGYWSWWAFLIPAALPLIALFPLSLALPKGSDFLHHPVSQVQGDRPFSEVLTLPLALSTIIPVFYGIWIASITNRGAEGLTAGGITTAIVSALAGIVYLATLGVDSLPWWLRWLVYFAIPVAAGIFFSITAIGNGGHGEGGRRALSLIYASPFLIAVIFAALYFAAVGIGAAASSTTTADVTFGILTGIFIIAVGVLWFVLPKKLRDARIPERPEPFSAERPHFVRLFDDTTLFHDPAQAGNAPLARRFYPSARRPLLKLWWEGTGDLYIRSRRLWLEFSFSGSGAPDQVVPAPIAPMTAVEFAHFLTATVKQQGGTTGKLKAAMVYPTDLDYELAPGATFADEGDPDEENIPSDFSAAQHDELAEKYHKLGTSQASTDYILYHAPKAVQAIRFGRNGPAPFDPREVGAPGLGRIMSNGIQVIGDGSAAFRSFFTPSDQISAKGQVRVVTLVQSNSRLVISSAFNPDLPAGTEYTRVGPDREPADGYTYVANPPGTVPGGESVMDYAADVAAMLCLGATPHLLSTAELKVTSLAGKSDPGGNAVDQNIRKVYQVFRNWSLDRRRVNEWRMLVAGGALSEKGESADGYDSAMTQPRDPAWTPQVAQGEATASARGWARVFRDWLTMAGKGGEDATNPAGNGAGPGAPSNLDLSRAIAFLFDTPSPVAVH